jgi:hypothetical protein
MSIIFSTLGMFVHIRIAKHVRNVALNLLLMHVVVFLILGQP